MAQDNLEYLLQATIHEQRGHAQIIVGLYPTTVIRVNDAHVSIGDISLHFHGGAVGTTEQAVEHLIDALGILRHRMGIVKARRAECESCEPRVEA